MALTHLLLSQFQPEPYAVYKPTKGGTGQALQLQLRLNPTWIETEAGGGYFERDKTHGLFLEIAPQLGKSATGHATFGWNSPQLVRCKLGLVDVTKWLVSYREVRLLGQEVPAAYRPGPDRNAEPYVMSSFHKFGTKSTAISVRFEESRTTIRISKSKTLARAIALDFHEELGFVAYLENALSAFLRVGIR